MSKKLFALALSAMLVLSLLAGHSTISSVPAPMRAHPSRAFAPACSWRKRKARARVMTTLSLSTGTTLETSPAWRAR